MFCTEWYYKISKIPTSVSTCWAARPKAGIQSIPYRLNEFGDLNAVSPPSAAHITNSSGY